MINKFLGNVKHIGRKHRNPKYVLRNIETDERIQFYPSDNTSFFNVNELPLVNTSIDLVSSQLDGDGLLEKLKRPNSKWSIESIYEYVLLTTPLPEVPIGSFVILPVSSRIARVWFHSRMFHITFAFGIVLLVTGML
jgi:hypothetical protein